jgi:hypothetical protein
LYTWCPRQFDVSGSSRIGGLIGAANSAGWWSAVRVGPVASKSNVPFGDGFLQTLILPLRNEHGQFVRLKLKTRIDYLHTAAKDAHVLG